MGFSRQEYWSGLPFPSPWDLDPGIEPTYLMSPALAGRFFTTSATWEAFFPKWLSCPFSLCTHFMPITHSSFIHSCASLSCHAIYCLHTPVIVALSSFVTFFSPYNTQYWLISVACKLSHVQLFVTPWTMAHQVPLSIGFSRQEY